MRRRLFGLGVGLAMIAAYGMASCGDPSHVFEGRYFLEGRGCLGTTSSVDVVEGERPGNCGPICLAHAHTDGGRSIYVATMCAPYPFGFDTSGSDPACPAALAALERNDTCLLDGGSSNPSPPSDAGSD
jgi:hypothetical protein